MARGGAGVGAGAATGVTTGVAVASVGAAGGATATWVCAAWVCAADAAVPGVAKTSGAEPDVMLPVPDDSEAPAVVPVTSAARTALLSAGVETATGLGALAEAGVVVAAVAPAPVTSAPTTAGLAGGVADVDAVVTRAPSSPEWVLSFGVVPDFPMIAAAVVRVAVAGVVADVPARVGSDGGTAAVGGADVADETWAAETDGTATVAAAPEVALATGFPVAVVCADVVCEAVVVCAIAVAGVAGLVGAPGSATVVLAAVMLAAVACTAARSADCDPGDCDPGSWAAGAWAAAGRATASVASVPAAARAMRADCAGFVESEAGSCALAVCAGSSGAFSRSGFLAAGWSLCCTGDSSLRSGCFSAGRAPIACCMMALKAPSEPLLWTAEPWCARSRRLLDASKKLLMLMG